MVDSKENYKFDVGVKVLIKLTVSRKTANKVAVGRKKWQILTVSRKRVKAARIAVETFQDSAFRGPTT